MYRVIVSDLDGTLLNRQHQISAYSHRVLDALAARGVDLILASGRPYADVEPLRRRLDIPMYLITCNGAQIFDPDGDLLCQREMEPGQVAALIHHGRQAGVHINVYRGPQWLVEAPNQALLALHRASGFTYRQVDLLACEHDAVVKVFFEGEPQRLQQLESDLRAAFGTALTVAFSLPNLLEVMAPGVNKGDALAQVLPRLSVSAEQVMAFGDGLNDLELLQSVGRGLVMRNAHPRLKAQLPGHTEIGDHCHDAVACYLQKTLLRDGAGRLPATDPCAPHPCAQACSNQLCQPLQAQILQVAPSQAA